MSFEYSKYVAQYSNFSFLKNQQQRKKRKFLNGHYYYLKKGRLRELEKRKDSSNSSSRLLKQKGTIKTVKIRAWSKRDARPKKGRFNKNEEITDEIKKKRRDSPPPTNPKICLRFRKSIDRCGAGHQDIHRCGY